MRHSPRQSDVGARAWRASYGHGSARRGCGTGLAMYTPRVTPRHRFLDRGSVEVFPPAGGTSILVVDTD